MKDISEIKNMLQATIGDRLYRHCTNVSETSIKLAKIYDVDEDKAKIAGLLHDCGKLLGKNIGNLEHANVGKEIAKTEYGIEDEEILDAILYHTTGRIGMSMLEKIIYLADKIEPDRKFDGVDKIREMSNVNIDKAVLMTFENTFNYLNQKGIEIAKESIDTYESIKNSLES